MAERKLRFVLPHRPGKRYEENIDAREDGRQAEEGQTSNDLVPGFERMDHWTTLGMAAASQLATYRERWRHITNVTAAHIVPPD